jgi:hypothetical protein
MSETGVQPEVTLLYPRRRQVVIFATFLPAALGVVCGVWFCVALWGLASGTGNDRGFLIAGLLAGGFGAALFLWFAGEGLRQLIRPLPSVRLDGDGLECACGRVAWSDAERVSARANTLIIELPVDLEPDRPTGAYVAGPADVWRSDSSAASPSHGIYVVFPNRRRTMLELVSSYYADEIGAQRRGEGPYRGN